MLQIYSNKPKDQTKFVVAMSGGVDSSTVAAYLHTQGYNVMGVTMQLYDQGVALQKKGACCAGQDIYDAKMVADKFGFPHYVLDYESLFKESVIEEFADSYIQGLTPIPCVRCNQTVKFRDLLKMAKDLGADGLVTGHYVRRIDGENGPELHKAVDETKDQSYFLFATTKEQLAYSQFPLGSLTKAQTRELAGELGLSIADKPDSQDICFVPDGNYAKIVEKLRPGSIEPGEIVHVSTGEVLGKHNGTINFTIGQRKGLGIGWEEALFVVKIDPKSKIVYVGEAHHLGKTNFWINNVNWLTSQAFPLKATVKLRSAHKGMEALIHKESDASYRVVLADPERAITPGQACVIYDGSQVMGGGWILPFKD